MQTTKAFEAHRGPFANRGAHFWALPTSGHCLRPHNMARIPRVLPQAILLKRVSPWTSLGGLKKLAFSRYLMKFWHTLRT